MRAIVKKTGIRTIDGWPAAIIAGAVALGTNGAALAQGGQVVGWGTYAYGNTRPPLASLLPWRAIAAGADHTLAIRADGSLTGWGDGRYEQLTIPSALQSGGVASVSGTSGHALALTTLGKVRAWGHNTYGQCNVPAWLEGDRALDVAAGGNHSVVLAEPVWYAPYGRVACWGLNDRGQCSPPPLTELVLRVAAGAGHSVLLTSTGAVRCWGSNDSGQSTVPMELPPAREIAAGAVHTVALCGDTVRCWGSDSHGQSDRKSVV